MGFPVIEGNTETWLVLFNIYYPLAYCIFYTSVFGVVLHVVVDVWFCVIFMLVYI